MRLNSYDEVKRLTKEMVQIRSINKMPGEESAAAQYVYDYYMQQDYFKKRPGQVKMFQTTDDFVTRHSTYAYVKGTGAPSDRTVILIGHIDTVGIDDFGTLKEFACDPDQLPEKLLSLKLPQEVIDDIRSGEYMFGRGALDMKSGVAGHMYLISYFAQHPEELSGNLIALAECDEEDGSHGVISALDEFDRLGEKEGFRYVACVNADYSTNYNPGDPNRYVYYGSIGKLLPCYCAFGKETHVGQAFAGFDPNLLIAEITREISLNTDLCDIAQGEVAIPPISLKQCDSKPSYTVQTPLTAYSYYNFFTHGLSPHQVLDQCKQVAVKAFDQVVERLNLQYRRYCRLSGVDHSPLPWKTMVYTWEEFYGELKAQYGTAFEEAIADFARGLHRQEPAFDMRMFSFRVVEEAWKWRTDKSPAVVLFFGSIYNARIEMTGKTPKEAALLHAVEQAVSQIREESGYPIATRMFYPYISDSSFMAVCDRLDRHGAIKGLGPNMPAWGIKYYHDVEKIRKIDVPVVNVGTFGRDGHMLTERVDMRHTFENVPNITYLTIRSLLNSEEDADSENSQEEGLDSRKPKGDPVSRSMEASSDSGNGEDHGAKGAQLR